LPQEARFALAVHGGASDLAGIDAARRRGFCAEAADLLDAILGAGAQALRGGATALDVVEVAVRAMEDSGCLNAGRGSTRNRAGEVQMDAAIMDGRTSLAGAVAAVRSVRNPVSAARLVMERSAHVLLVGPEAERFAVELGVERVEASYFRPVDEPSGGDSDTVGAVALDANGNLAAATSTGGISGKLPGRVGDSPLIGAGTYADNATAAISATGHGEYFMRLVLAHEVAAMMRHGGVGIEEATRWAIDERLEPAGGRGGLIAVDRRGTVAMAMNTAFMPRGCVGTQNATWVAVER
jgi:isoaspartyl peptidase/L-asparaginase-like protein (Ntn-hydrolase superfamily)